MSERKGTVQTVLGPVAPEVLGVTLPHEHLLLDIAKPEVRDRQGTPITLENLGHVRRYWHLNPWDARLFSIAEAVDELAHYRDAGGRTVVEVTSIGLQRDPEGLRRIARETGLHVVMGCSYYLQPYHPPEVARMSEADITARIVRDIAEGADGTDVRAGIIGEVGLTWPVHPDEEKVLRASVAAQRETGAALMIHPGRHTAAPAHALEIVREAGGDLARTVMAHIDRTVFDPDAMLRLADTGCTLEFDLFGQESSYYPMAPIDMPNDAVRIDHLRRLIAAGHRERLLAAQDICHKHGFKRYGGDGYSHILENVVPVMRRKGMSEADIEAILVRNPARLLAFV